MNPKDSIKGESLPPLPPAGPVELIYGADPHGALTVPVGLKRAVSVPIERMAEYLEHYGLKILYPIDIPEGPPALAVGFLEVESL